MPNHSPFSLRIDGLDSSEAKIDSEMLPKSAAVLLAITDNSSDSELIFTRRADHLNSHSGQVSFPGGRWESCDADLAQTALRETQEEIGLRSEQVRLLGSLDARLSKNGLYVQPYVGLIHVGVELVVNPDEIAEIFTVPLKFFKKQKPSRLDVLSRNGLQIRVPAWNYEGQDIWGLSAMFTLDLLKRINIKITLEGVPLNYREKRIKGKSG